VQEAWSGIDVQLRRRASLIPNLMETVRGYAEYEREVFEERRSRAWRAAEGRRCRSGGKRQQSAYAFTPLNSSTPMMTGVPRCTSVSTEGQRLRNDRHRRLRPDERLPMSASTESALVYERIDTNRQNTRLLMATFVLLLLPLAGGLAQYLTPESIFNGAVTRDGLNPTLSQIWAELMTTVIVLVAIAGATMFVAVTFSSSLLLQHVGARRVKHDDQPQLCRTVENLCIGAGLPAPAIYVVESDVANAFATGSNPKHASLVVTTGLLSLLTSRELTAVIAHELSHIGNYDTRLGTMLAAAVATLRFPKVAAVAIWRLMRRLMQTDQGRGGVAFVMLLGRPMIAALLWTLSGILTIGFYVAFSDMHEGLRVWRLLGVLTPLYVLFGAPAIATGLRRMISQEREFLADADAVLLTRDPDGLALALAKVGRAVAPGMKAGAASAHLYFVDPLPPGTSLWDRLYEVHPPLADRIERIAAMGDGIPPDELEAAEQVGREYGERLYVKNVRTQLPAELRPVELKPGMAEQLGERLDVQLADLVPGMKVRLTQAETPLYQNADGWSPVIERLPEGAIIEFIGLEANFVRVATDRVRGCISRGTVAKRLGDART
jgi:heat shock protein HtpX